MEFLAIPALILFCILPFFLIYKGIQTSNKRQNKAEQIFREITTCKKCGKRNYEINLYVHEEHYQDSSNDFSEISKNFKIRCKTCNLITYDQTFNSTLQKDGGYGLGKQKDRDINDRNYYDVRDQELINELKFNHFYGQGCSQYIMIISGIGLLILLVIAFLLSGLTS